MLSYQIRPVSSRRNNRTLTISIIRKNNYLMTYSNYADCIIRTSKIQIRTGRITRTTDNKTAEANVNHE